MKHKRLSCVLLSFMVMGSACNVHSILPPTTEWPPRASATSAVTTTPPAFATGSTGTAAPAPSPTLRATDQPVATPTIQSTLTPAATPAPGLTESRLQYLIIARFGRAGATPPVFFCDSDSYPVARNNEDEAAQKWLDSVGNSGDEYNDILAHLGLSNASLTPAQKLLVYREHKLLGAVTMTAAENGYQFSVRVSQRGSGLVIAGQQTDGMIDLQGNITAVKQRNVPLVCPICLARGTRIDTPSGTIAVQDISVGMTVWTQNARGERIAAPVVRVTHTSVPVDHHVVHIRLSDGRELHASPGHPTTDGRVIGDLAPGDFLDDARVISADFEAYSLPATYDVLPAGSTGFYWADGVLIASTLK